MQVNNNTAAFNVWRNYTNNTYKLRNSMAKLSSGTRINNAGDDPSGLAMSERMRSQIRNTAAEASNVENSLNKDQTADSWLQKVHDMMGRMSELAISAQDPTKSVEDKAALTAEYTAMSTEIASALTADFNGVALFVGTEDDGLVLDLTDPVASAAAVSTAIDTISTARAALGAAMSSAKHRLEGLRSYEENIRATESRIRDVDVAKETAEMTKYNILQQVGTAMLAQANQLPQSVLQLLG